MAYTHTFDTTNVNEALRVIRAELPEYTVYTTTRRGESVTHVTVVTSNVAHLYVRNVMERLRVMEDSRAAKR